MTLADLKAEASTSWAHWIGPRSAAKVVALCEVAEAAEAMIAPFAETVDRKRLKEALARLREAMAKPSEKVEGTAPAGTSRVTEKEGPFSHG